MQNPTDPKHWKVSEVAERAHVTVRTLHHYDEIRLLVPSGRSAAGYRQYSEADLERLYQILLYRELGFPLEAIASLVDAPAMDRRSVFLAQCELLVERRRKTDAVVRVVDRALESMERGEKMSSEGMFEGFDALSDAPEEVRRHQAEHGQEAKERWGGTATYRESMRRARGYTKPDWQKIQEEGEAMAGAEAMREHITRWFYPCSYQIHAGLADMYEVDPRFAAHYERRRAGLAGFVATAIRANAMRTWDEGAE